jgi:hypothetical protein
MFKKLLPIVVLIFVTACANTQGGSQSGMGMKMPCCEKCDCCKDGECKCCKGGMCKMCMGKMEDMSSMKEGMQCPIMQGDKKDGMKCGCFGGMMKDGMTQKQSMPATKKPTVNHDVHNSAQ